MKKLTALRQLKRKRVSRALFEKWLFCLASVLAFSMSIQSVQAQLMTVNNQPATFLDGFQIPAVAGYAYGPAGGPWSFFGGAGISKNNTAFTNGNPRAPQGNQVLFLQGTSRVSRNFNISQAGFYRLHFQAALRGNMPNQQQNVGMHIDGVNVGELSVPGTNYSSIRSLTIYLGTGQHTVELRGTRPVVGDHTAFVDALELERIHDWHDPQTWGGAVPGANNTVTIKANTAVAVRGTINVKRIMVHGQLLGAQNRNVNISTHNVMVMGNGSLLEFGQELAPYTKKAIITLIARPGDAVTAHPTMGNNFLGAMANARLEIHGLFKNSWTKLQAVLPNKEIRLATATNWKAGDQIVVTSNRNNWNEAEQRTIQSVSEGGKLLRLTQALTHPHPGGVRTYQRGSKTWTADLRAEVGLLTHNIKIQGATAGANAGGYGGHIMIMSNSKAHVENIELYRMGQKAILSRYPFHWHMLGATGNGQYLKNSSIHKSFNRAVTIHGTESTLVENNFCYDHIGHGIFLEDGSERFNVIRKNVVLLTKRPLPREELTPSDNERDEVQNRTPASFWITNPQNTFEDNVVAGTQGTGYWFAFPQKPMGLSANDPRFGNMKPHTLPLIRFRGNTAHSCMSGFDIFDQLSPSHSILPNKGWLNNGNHLIENCLWYANNHSLYTGLGTGGRTDNLIFENNILVENYVGTMFASYSIVRNSVFVARSGFNLIPPNQQRHAYRVYDGAGQVHNSHFVGWNHATANLLMNTGASTKHPNHYFTGNTTDHSGFARCVLPNFNIEPIGVADAGSPLHPRVWPIIIKDATGGITKKANTTLVSNHPFILVGDEFKPNNWTNAYRSDHHFALTMLVYEGVAIQNYPDIIVTREKPGTISQHVYYVLGGSTGFKEVQKLPMIVNENYDYVYNFTSLPTGKKIYIVADDAKAGDSYITRFKNFGKLSGLRLSSPRTFRSYNSLSALRNSNVAGYYIQNNGDLFVKVVAVAKRQTYEIRWTGNTVLPALDTDGDEMPDIEEQAKGRHMFDASDLAAEFNQNNDLEGWSNTVNIGNRRVQGGSLSGTSANNGDAIIANDVFRFRSDRVRTVRVRMKASSNTLVQMFFGTNIAPGYSGSRVVSASYTGNGNWQTLTFNMGNHAAWNNLITNLRLDPVSGVNINFDVDWIKGSCPGCPNGGASAARTTEYIGQVEANQPNWQKQQVYPNPVSNKLFIKGVVNGCLVQIYDLNGKLLQILSYKDAIDFSTFAKGTYLIQCQEKSYRIVKK